MTDREDRTERVKDTERAKEAPQWFTRMDDTLKGLLLDRHEVTDEERFCGAFMGCGTPALRRRAVTRIRDQDRLFAYAAHDPDPVVRAKAAAALRDDALKLRVIETDPEAGVQEAAAAAVTDEAALYGLAASHPQKRVRKAAVLRMNDNENLMRIVLSQDADSEIRYLAAGRISDPAVMKRVLMSPDLRITPPGTFACDRNLLAAKADLMYRIPDPDLKRRTAADRREYEQVRVAAVSGLGEGDQELLREIAADRPADPDLYDRRELRAAAVSRLTDEGLLRRYLVSDTWEVRLAAMTALKDQDVLKETVLDAGCGTEMRKTALRCVTDPAFLCRIAMEGAGSPGGRGLAAIAAGMITEPEMLADIAIGSASFEASGIAARALHDDAQLLRVLREAPADGPEAQAILCAAADNLKDLRPLVRILLDDPGDVMCGGAVTFKEYGIDLLTGDTESLLAYVREETDRDALACVLSRTDDRRVRRAVADNPHSGYRLRPETVGRRAPLPLAEIGLGEKTENP